MGRYFQQSALNTDAVLLPQQLPIKQTSTQAASSLIYPGFNQDNDRVVYYRDASSNDYLRYYNNTGSLVYQRTIGDFNNAHHYFAGIYMSVTATLYILTTKNDGSECGLFSVNNTGAVTDINSSIPLSPNSVTTQIDNIGAKLVGGNIIFFIKWGFIEITTTGTLVGHGSLGGISNACYKTDDNYIISPFGSFVHNGSLTIFDGNQIRSIGQSYFTDCVITQWRDYIFLPATTYATTGTPASPTGYGAYSLVDFERYIGELAQVGGF